MTEGAAFKEGLVKARVKARAKAAARDDTMAAARKAVDEVISAPRISVKVVKRKAAARANSGAADVRATSQIVEVAKMTII